MPSKSDILCLQAAFATPELARQSWQTFCRDWSFDDLSPDLIPLVLANVGVDESHKFCGLMKGYSRYQWCKNQVVMQDLTAILHQFDLNSVPVMLGGMFSVMHHAYPDFAARSLNSVDLISSVGDVPKGQKILDESRAGLKSHAKFKVTSSVADFIGPRRSRRAWNDAVECQIFDRKALSMSLEDTLIYVLISYSHGPHEPSVLADLFALTALAYRQTLLNDKLNHYRVVNLVQKNSKQLVALLRAANLSERCNVFMPLDKFEVGLVESILNMAPYAGSLLAAGSTLIERLDGAKPKAKA